jgi:hexosaminidase
MRTLTLLLVALLSIHLAFSTVTVTEEGPKAKPDIPHNLWPIPASYKTGTNTVAIKDPCNFSFNILNKDTNPQIPQLIALYRKYMFTRGCKTLPTTLSTPTVDLNSILTIYIKDVKEYLMNSETDESYNLYITNGVLALNASTYIGLVRGLETFSQLLTVTVSGSSFSYSIQSAPITITDSPRFPHRGVMVDTARHFIAKEKLFQVMDAMVSVKLNVFHWHISDSDSFPIYLPSRPTLSKYGAFSDSEVYSEQDVKDIVNYAILRGIRIVPEIDSPSHTGSLALDPAVHDKVFCADSIWYRGIPFGQLNPTLDEIYNIFADIFKDLKNYFPWDTIHLGCDEVFSRCWNVDQVNNWMKSHGIADYNALFNYYIKKIRPLVDSQQKNKVYWTNPDTLYLNFESDEILQWWGTTDQLAAGMTHYPKNRYILSNFNYLYLDCGAGNYFGNKSWCDPYHTWLDIYSFEPTKTLNAEQMKRVVGLEAALWSEINDGSSTLNKIFPRTNSMAERAWSPVSHDYQSNYAVFVRLDAWRRHIHHRGIDVVPLTSGYCEKHPDTCFLNS